MGLLNVGDNVRYMDHVQISKSGRWYGTLKIIETNVSGVNGGLLLRNSEGDEIYEHEHVLEMA